MERLADVVEAVVRRVRGKEVLEADVDAEQVAE